ncbi:hypothetical protein HK104_006293 [Borealophlyctis nickersoniae]|nr:hypothetical protein HK104_006293 [Borealophlyctis nickersoniae]
MPANANAVPIKFHLPDSRIFRFILNESCILTDLLDSIRRKSRLRASVVLTVSYTDDEGDIVHIVDDDDVNGLFHFASGMDMDKLVVLNVGVGEMTTDSGDPAPEAPVASSIAPATPTTPASSSTAPYNDAAVAVDSDGNEENNSDVDEGELETIAHDAFAGIVGGEDCGEVLDETETASFNRMIQTLSGILDPVSNVNDSSPSENSLPSSSSTAPTPWVSP